MKPLWTEPKKPAGTPILHWHTTGTLRERKWQGQDAKAGFMQSNTTVVLVAAKQANVKLTKLRSHTSSDV